MSAPHLHPLHLADLKSSGLSDETIQAMGVKSMKPGDISKLASGGLPRVDSVLEFPYPSLSFSRYKLFPPVGTLKYFQLKGSSCHLYVLSPVAEKLTNILEPLFIVEGEKKTAAAVQAGLNAIGIGGVWNWKAGRMEGNRGTTGNSIRRSCRRTCLRFGHLGAR
jgi:Domain of unknown function (DUF3854)